MGAWPRRCAAMMSRSPSRESTRSPRSEEGLTAPVFASKRWINGRQVATAVEVNTERFDAMCDGSTDKDNEGSAQVRGAARFICRCCAALDAPSRLR